MIDRTPRRAVIPFPPDYRASGILLHVTSLPSPYGIGGLGPAAIRWIDRLADAGQRWWQCLPLGPTGYANSPYQPPSSFAANVLLVSPDWLAEDGLLRPRDYAWTEFPDDRVDYPRVERFKLGLVRQAWANFRARPPAGLRPAFEKFCQEQRGWLDDYALFRALKARFNDVHYLQWPTELLRRERGALARAGSEQAAEMDIVRFGQFLLFRQGDRLKQYARVRGIGLIGDIPFYPSADSADVWSHPEFFRLDKGRRPAVVAGVPPDYFAPQGQLWGNPAYDWDALRGVGYSWWVNRLLALLEHVDVVRLDHFRGFCAAWQVPAAAQTAQTGEWVPGPGAALFDAVRRAVGGLPFIAEDLGEITPDVVALRDRLGLPGTRVLQFGFDGDPTNPHLSHMIPHNAVAFTGTHDNDTTRGWFSTLPENRRQIVRTYPRAPTIDASEVAPELLRLAWGSPAALAMAPFQDVLNLGSEARMNIPGRADGNWCWRCRDDQLGEPVFERLRGLSAESNRLAAVPTRNAKPELART
jgi:4-alpha-glucanotransferase